MIFHVMCFFTGKVLMRSCRDTQVILEKVKQRDPEAAASLKPAELLASSYHSRHVQLQL